MTKEEILAMEAATASPDIIATEVMQWHRSARSRDWLNKDRGFQRNYFWNPWVDILAAWPIVAKMGLALIPLNDKDWVCCKANYIYHMDIRQDHYTDPNLVICRTAPEAICKAALLTKLEGG